MVLQLQQSYVIELYSVPTLICYANDPPIVPSFGFESQDTILTLTDLFTLDLNRVLLSLAGEAVS